VKKTVLLPNIEPWCFCLQGVWTTGSAHVKRKLQGRPQNSVWIVEEEDRDLG